MNTFRALFFYSLLLAFPVSARTAACEQPAAKLVALQGTANRQASGSSEWIDVRQDDIFCAGDTLRTEKWSRATLALSNQTLVTLDQNSTLIFSEPAKKSSSWFIELLEGVTYFRSRQPQRLNIQTPFVNAVHEGTEFLVAVDARQAEITVLDGQVKASNAAGVLHIPKGFVGTASAGQAPQLHALTITPIDAVQWSLYYPPLVDFQHYAAANDSAQSAALAAYSQGKPAEALALLEKAAPSPDKDVLQAALLLTVGRVDDAAPIIDRALNAQQNNSGLYALKSVIAVAKNRNDDALALAKQAETLNPSSAAAKIARSYAQQAHLKIDEALAATQQAASLAPNDALVWARLAELQLSTGQREAALASAQEAERLNPALGRTQTVLGFAYLAQADTGHAHPAFHRALELDGSDPSARLGLALAKIRAGELDDGVRDLEIAVNLDPGNAIMRSYLGKGYYELRNKTFAGTELNLAKELDPLDPTPWFYDAILKQTTNRPVAALHDMQKAIELNDNRGVYRSSLLLDKDLAARSAAQGRIYNELGFGQAGLLEGWKSVNQDQGDYSAHRLLADNYSVLPRHEFARISELLQSQLLQPVNITPIQPHLAESNLFILNGLGPSELSFNEFNPLFEHDRTTLQASGIYASNNTVGDNTTLSGLYGNASFSLGQFHYETDGFRANNFLRKNLYNAFFQQQVTDLLNLQVEYRHEETRNGDLTLNFNLDNFNKDYRVNRVVDLARLGGRYDFTPNSTLIGSLIYQNVNTNQHQTSALIPNFLTLEQDLRQQRSGFNSELQHRFTYAGYTSVTGFGHIEQLLKDSTKTLAHTNGLPDSLSFSQPTYTPTLRSNFYHYSTFNFGSQLSATLGVSVDYFQKGKLRFAPVNPKLGIIWKPSHATTLRAAAFRSLSMTQNSNQTIEPTQVAGFNQFFDDFLGTTSWRYGAGLDHKFNRQLSGGLEYSERQLYYTGNSFGVDRFEQFARSYLYFTPHDWVAVSGEYFYEKITNPPSTFSSSSAPTGGLFDNVKTHRIPISFDLFHPSGFSFKIRNSFVHQTGVFQDFTVGSKAPGHSSFFIVDLNLSYRLPNRHGMLTLGINNLFDDRLHFQNTNNNEPILAPGRVLFSRISLAL